MTATLLLSFLMALSLTVVVVLGFRVFASSGSQGLIQDRIKRTNAPSGTVENIELRLRGNEAGAGFLERLNFSKIIARQINKSKLKITATRFIIVCALAITLSFLLLNLVHMNPLPAIIISIFVAYIPFFFLKRVEAKRLAIILEQFPNALNMMANTLKVGHTLEAAVASVTHAMPEPIAGEFRIILSELELGQSLVDALHHMHDRLYHQDIQMFATAVAIQMKTGGNLGEMLRNLEDTVRERFALRREIKALSAEGRSTVIILSVIPFVVMGSQLLLNREKFIEFFSSDIGKVCFMVAGGLMTFGLLWCRKIVTSKI